MIDRRKFLQHSASFVSTASCPFIGKTWRPPLESGSQPNWEAEYEQTLRTSKWLPGIGTPRDWNLVRQGLYPFASERVAILNPPFATASDRKLAVLGQCAGWREKFWRQFPEHRNYDECHSEITSRDRGWLTISNEKFEVILRIIGALEEHYSSGHDFEKWAAGLAVREEEHFYEYPVFPAAEKSSQSRAVWPDVPVRLAQRFLSCFSERYEVTANERVDWWVFLFPSGAEWDDFHGEPAHVQLGLVMSGDDDRIHHERCELEAIKFLPVLLQRLDVREISVMSQFEVARLLNQTLGHYLRQLATAGNFPGASI